MGKSVRFLLKIEGIVIHIGEILSEKLTDFNWRKTIMIYAEAP